MFKVRYKPNSNTKPKLVTVYYVRALMRDYPLANPDFLIFDEEDKKWKWIFSDECIPEDADVAFN